METYRKHAHPVLLVLEKSNGRVGKATTANLYVSESRLDAPLNYKSKKQ